MNYVKILGSSGSKSKNLGTTSFQISRDIIIDTGNVINILGDKSSLINHIFLTHSHSDHIADLPFLLDSFFENRKEILTIYASKETIEVLKEHTFNDKVWPDFSKINLIGSENKSLAFKEIKENKIVHSFHLLKTREAANQTFVEVHLVFDNLISLVEAHKVSDSIESKIKKLDKKRDWNITIHLDPYDDLKVDKFIINN